MTEPAPRPVDPSTAARGSARRERSAVRDVFGDVLPDTTADERERGLDGSDQEASSDAWHRAQRPPHHDRA